MKINPDDPAFPAEWVAQDPDNGQSRMYYTKGMTVRQEIAKAAMVGMLVAGKGFDLGTTVQEIAKASVQMADAMITELNK